MNQSSKKENKKIVTIENTDLECHNEIVNYLHAKEAADFVADTNDNDGVAKAIAHFCLTE